MIKISNIRMPARFDERTLPYFASKQTGIDENSLTLNKILKLSIDSRKKPDVYKVFTAAFLCESEEDVLRKNIKNVTRFEERPYRFPFTEVKTERRPVVVGFGPSGIFAALVLTEAGLPPIVLERGVPVEDRIRDVENFWKKGILDPESNVQFGEGGAGMFSDGKLTTGINDERISFVLSRLVQFGAPKEIMYLAKPHVGTDKLRTVIVNIRNYLKSQGCEIRFGHKLIGIGTENDVVTSLIVKSREETYSLNANAVLLSIGNSARDTFRLLNENGLKMEPKAFAVGVRIEHLQKKIDISQYGEAATLGTLPASDYKLAVHLKNGRSVFTFCVCPGGQVIASSSEHCGVVTNGMSEHARDNDNINGGLLVSVTPSDFNGELFGGMDFQRMLEKKAYLSGGENYDAPAQLVGDFLNRTVSKEIGSVIPSYKPGVKLCNLWDVLPWHICASIAEAIVLMDKKIRGFADSDAIITAVETRSSSPIRITRDEYGMSSVTGIFPCGEGAGYAGGIITASVDGIKSAENLCVYLSNR